MPSAHLLHVSVYAYALPAIILQMLPNGFIAKEYIITPFACKRILRNILQGFKQTHGEI